MRDLETLKVYMAGAFALASIAMMFGWILGTYFH
jgi:hypothetical protein